MMFLFRVTLKPTDVWSKFYNKKLKPIYLVAETKDAALRLAEKHLKDGLSAKSITKLGEQLASHIYRG